MKRVISRRNVLALLALCVLWGTSAAYAESNAQKSRAVCEQAFAQLTRNAQMAVREANLSKGGTSKFNIACVEIPVGTPSGTQTDSQKPADGEDLTVVKPNTTKPVDPAPVVTADLGIKVWFELQDGTLVNPIKHRWGSKERFWIHIQTAVPVYVALFQNYPESRPASRQVYPDQAYPESFKPLAANETTRLPVLFEMDDDMRDEIMSMVVVRSDCGAITKVPETENGGSTTVQNDPINEEENKTDDSAPVVVEPINEEENKTDDSIAVVVAPINEEENKTDDSIAVVVEPINEEENKTDDSATVVAEPIAIEEAEPIAIEEDGGDEGSLLPDPLVEPIYDMDLAGNEEDGDDTDIAEGTNETGEDGEELIISFETEVNEQGEEHVEIVFETPVTLEEKEEESVQPQAEESEDTPREVTDSTEIELAEGPQEETTPILTTQAVTGVAGTMRSFNVQEFNDAVVTGAGDPTSKSMAASAKFLIAPADTEKSDVPEDVCFYMFKTGPLGQWQLTLYK